MSTTPTGKRGSVSAAVDSDSGDLASRQRRTRTFKTRKAWSEQETKELVQRRDNGETFPELSRRYGVSVAAVTQRYGKIKSVTAQGLSTSDANIIIARENEDLEAHDTSQIDINGLNGFKQTPGRAPDSLENGSIRPQTGVDQDTIMTGTGPTVQYQSPYFGNLPLCSVCSQPESTNVNTFVTCSKCSSLFHKQCHDPPVATAILYDTPWQCNPCAVGPWQPRPLPLLLVGPSVCGLSEEQQKINGVALASRVSELQTEISESTVKLSELEKKNLALEQRLAELTGKRAEKR